MPALGGIVREWYSAFPLHQCLTVHSLGNVTVGALKSLPVSRVSN